jgi:hypothetical protein
MRADHRMRVSKTAILSLGIWMLLVACSGAVGIAADTQAAPADTPLRGEFRIGKEGRLILLPVQLGQKTYSFVLDTGCSRTIFDTTLKGQLGTHLGSTSLMTAGGQLDLQTFDWPRAGLGNQTLKSDRSVLCQDLKEIREFTGEEVFGILGMDVLYSSLLQIDFDNGVVRFLERLPMDREELGEKLSMELPEFDQPTVVAVVGGERLAEFLIDTGADAPTLNTRLFDALVKQQLLRIGMPYDAITPAGRIHVKAGRLDNLSIASFEHESTRVVRGSENAIGLRYLSRFTVTFDFPEEALYLRKGKRYSKPDAGATSGLVLRRIDGLVVVDSVPEDSPAQKAGILAQDVILEIDGKDVAHHDFFSLREILTTEVGRKVAIRIRREGREMSVEIVLAEN